MTKTCSKCSATKDAVEFYKPGNVCKVCFRARVTARYHSLGRVELDRRKVFRDANKPLVVARRKVDYDRNRERYIDAAIRWKRANPHRWALERANERAKRAGAVLSLSVEEWTELWEGHRGLCLYCGGAASGLDHSFPLSRGGEHAPENVVPACRTCNSGKRDRTPLEWFLSDTPRSRTVLSFLIKPHGDSG